MRISGGNRFGRHWHHWMPLDNDVSTDKVCLECGAVRTWNGKRWKVVRGKRVLKQDLKRDEERSSDSEKDSAVLGKKEIEAMSDKSEKKDFKCVLCGCEVKGITVHDFRFDEKRTDVDWQLCPNHAILWVLRRLSPEDVKKVREMAGGVTFATHGDFYDEDGYSVQPVGG